METVWPFKDTPQHDVKRWATGLKYMRLCKGQHWGHANEGDGYKVKLAVNGSSDVLRIFDIFHIKKMHIQSDRYASINVLALPGYRNHPVRYCDIFFQIFHSFVIIYFEGENGNYATEGDFENAKFIDLFINECSSLVIDPPLESENCICPKYYPELWL